MMIEEKYVAVALILYALAVLAVPTLHAVTGYQPTVTWNKAVKDRMPSADFIDVNGNDNKYIMPKHRAVVGE